VLADAYDSQVDVHSYTLDDAGGNIFASALWSEHLTGRGRIDGYPVRSIAPEWLVTLHTGYEADKNERHDVRLLCERFGIELPGAYRTSS
jgi:lincosamide nucleotidyltransferase A/C/D/E